MLHAKSCNSEPRKWAMWKNDAELFEMAKRELFTAVVGDVM